MDMRCQECGADVWDEDIFCSKCGKKIDRKVVDNTEPISIKKSVNHQTVQEQTRLPISFENIKLIVIGAVLIAVVMLVVMMFTGKPTGKYYRGHRDSDGTFEYIGNDYFEFKIGGDLDFMQAGSIEHGTYSVKKSVVNVTIPSFGRTVMLEWDKSDNELIYHDGGYIEVWKK